MPGGGGAGVLPPVWDLPRGTATVAFACVVGSVNPIKVNDIWNGPSGNGGGPTDVESFDGIAGIVDRENAMFVTGVFLTAAEPRDPAPDRLDFTDKEHFDLLAPRVGQVFFIGDGVDHRYRVPKGATRLFVGFADAYFYAGRPGWYGNNAGQVELTVEAAAS